MKLNTHTLKVKVTDEHIKRGKPDSCDSCAISLAIQSAIDKDGIPWKASVSMAFSTGEASIGLYAWEGRAWDSDNVKSCSIVKAKYPYEESNQIKINYFVKEFDKNFKWDNDKREAIPKNPAEHCKPFEFELRVIT